MHLAFLFVFVLLFFWGGGGGGGVEGFGSFFFTYIYILHLTQQCYNFFSPSTGFELTPLIHYNTNRLALCPAP